MSSLAVPPEPSKRESEEPKSKAWGKLHGRAFYESIGSPKFILAPMVDQSEFVWRVLSRSFLPPEQRAQLLAYTPMFHARLFAESAKYRETHFQPTRVESLAKSTPNAPPGRVIPWLDGNPALDRPLFIQFCANNPKDLLGAAKLVAPYCDAVDLNLGCPQGIARKGHYGAFLQEDQDLIFRLINTLHAQLPIPITAKIRILETKEATLAYARNILAAGASILTVHGRRREQKGHLTGLADWEMIRFLRDNLPPDTVLFANGNILQSKDLERCLAATGADGVMSAEGNLSNPAIFGPPPPPGENDCGYWRGKDGKGGWRVDAVMRRYLDLLRQHVDGCAPPTRRPLFVPGDDTSWIDEAAQGPDEPLAKKRRVSAAESRATSKKKDPGPNYGGAQAHLFYLLRHFVSRHHDVRDRLARARSGDVAVLEEILDLIERRVARGILAYKETDGRSWEEELAAELELKRSITKAGGDSGPEKEMEEGKASQKACGDGNKGEDDEDPDEGDPESSARAVRECRRPWWVCQPIIRPLPKEALAKGAIQPKKKQRNAQGVATPGS